MTLFIYGPEPALGTVGMGQTLTIAHLCRVTMVTGLVPPAKEPLPPRRD